jgi:5'-3' exonuclease
MSPSVTLHLVDASIYIFRAWFSLPSQLSDADGWPSNAVHGFTRTLLDLLEGERPQHIAVAFDEALESSFRNQRYPPYKANREPAPDELKRQFAHCKAVCAALGLAVLADSAYEADDLIGSAQRAARPHGLRAVVVSADKDLSQLLTMPGDEQFDIGRQRWDASGVMERHGVRPEQIADYLALAGDASDNIPGVPGIGSRTAATLLAHFGSLDAILARHDEVAGLRLRGAARVARALAEHADAARLYRELTTIACHVPLGAEAPFTRRAGDPEAITRLAAHLRFGPETRRRLIAACTPA